MSCIWDLYDALQRTDTWIVLHYLKSLEQKKMVTSKCIAKCLQKPHRKVVSALVRLQRSKLVEKRLIPFRDKYPKHWWKITDEGLSLIESRKRLDSEGYFRTTQKLNALISSANLLE